MDVCWTVDIETVLLISAPRDKNDLSTQLHEQELDMAMSVGFAESVLEKITTKDAWQRDALMRAGAHEPGTTGSTICPS